MRLHKFGVGLMALLAPVAAVSGARPAPPPRISLTYADLADLALAAPIAAHVRIVSAIPLKGTQATNVPAGVTRFYIEADVLSLIRGAGGVPAQVRYLADVPLDPATPTRIRKKTEYLVLGSPVPSRPGELRLAAPDAQIPWSEEIGQRARGLLTEAAAADAAPRIVGVGKAFHVPGTLPGESETQLFLLAADGRPISLSILRRPGQAPTWAVALGEIVDEAAAPPRQDTLLWYRLACTLPRDLPAQTVSDTDPMSATAIRADYALVIERLGSCVRNRQQLGQAPSPTIR